VRAQDTLYYEANWLSNIADGNHQFTINDKVFAEVKLSFPDAKNAKDLQAAFLTNPFLAGFVIADKSIVDSVMKIKPRLDLQPPKQGFASGVPSALKNTDVTTLTNGVADLMISRAKQELTIVFFDKFQAYANSHRAFKTLFPATTANLENLLAYNYTQMLPQLREGFMTDLSKLPYNLEALLELPYFQNLFKNFPEVNIAVQTLEQLQLLQNGKIDAAGLLSNIAAFGQWDSAGSNAFVNAGSVIKFAAILSNSLRNKNSDSIWITTKDIAIMLKDKWITQLYLGLLDQELKNYQLAYYSGTTQIFFYKLLENHQNDILLLQNRIAQFASLSEAVNTAYEELQKVKNNTTMSNFMGASIDAANYACGFIQILDPEFNGQDYLAIVGQANSLYKDIYSQQYTQAISDGLNILTSIYTLSGNNKTNAANGISAYAVASTPAYKKTAGDLLTFLQDVKPFALFIANMADAKDEQGVEAALENSILPVGSSAIKKNTKCNLAIQSYLGAFYQPWPNVSGSSPDAWSDKFGVIAPIGIAWTPRCGSWQKGGSLSLFGSVFDIGAVVDYKLQVNTPATGSSSSTSTVSKNYSIQLGQIFSPGLYLVYGCFGNLPLAFGIGGQYGPGLSKINSNATEVTNNPSWRWNVFLAVDLPFFNLINKNRQQVEKKK
jgi:hypothetical protein